MSFDTATITDHTALVAMPIGYGKQPKLVTLVAFRNGNIKLASNIPS